MSRWAWGLLPAFCLLGIATEAPAQAPYPAKPIRILVPYAPGGLTDVVARLYAEQLRQSLGQGVFVENKPGASGIVAIEEMARARPDGYTHHDRQHLDQRADAGPAREKNEDRLRAGTCRSSPSSPTFRCSFWRPRRTDFPPKTFAEFLAYAKAHPGKVRYGSAGIGSYQQINTEILAKRAGLELVHIPFKDGGAEIIRDLANGDIQVSWFNITNPVGMMKAGRVRPLAISAPSSGLPSYPDVPTLAEVGFPGMRASQWVGRLRAVRRAARHHRDAAQGVRSRRCRRRTCRRRSQRGGMLVPRQASLEDAQAWLREEMASLEAGYRRPRIIVDE